MITLPETKVESAATTKIDGRPVLHAVYFDAENKVAVAADGWILAVVPCETDETALVAVETVKECRKNKTNKTFDVAPDGQSVSFCSKAGNVTVETVQGTFPRYQSVAVDRKRPDDDGTVTIGISVKLLARLAEAVSYDGDHIALTIDTANLSKPYTVHSPTHYGEKDAFGMIMPYRLDR